MIRFGWSRGNVLSEDVVSMNPSSKRRALPKAWPANVKMAVLHVIALAHAAPVLARSIAVNSPDARTRRAGDLQGSLDEIAMLEEELHIKDGLRVMSPSESQVVSACQCASYRKHNALGTQLYVRMLRISCMTRALLAANQLQVNAPGYARGRGGPKCRRALIAVVSLVLLQD